MNRRGFLGTVAAAVTAGVMKPEIATGAPVLDPPATWTWTDDGYDAFYETRLKTGLDAIKRSSAAKGVLGCDMRELRELCDAHARTVADRVGLSDADRRAVGIS